jgi:hypothetical protein
MNEYESNSKIVKEPSFFTHYMIFNRYKNDPEWYGGGSRIYYDFEKELALKEIIKLRKITERHENKAEYILVKIELPV